MTNATSQDEVTLLLIKGVISDLPADDQVKVKQCAEQLTTTVKEAGVYGALALALVGAEAAAKA
jgi:hypothetical protein